MRTRALAPVLCVLLPACGASTPPPAPAAPSAPPAPPPTAMVPAEQPPDLSPVPEPKNLVLVGRVKDLQGSMRALETALKLPVSLQQLVSKELGDPDLESVLKTDSPIDVSILLDPAAKEPEFNLAFSLPLKSFDQARAIAERDGKLTKVRPGVLRLGGSKRKGDLVCNLAMSVGDAPARVVCSPRDRDLDALVPWMTRGLPAVAAPSSDLHVEAKYAPIEEKFGPFLRENAGRVRGMAAVALARELGVKDPAVADLAGDLAQEGIATSAELDTLTIDASLDPKAPAGAMRGTLKLKGSQSMIGRVMTMSADRAGAAPPLFWQLPKDATSGSFGYPIDQKIWTGPRAALARAVGGLARGALDDADASAIEAVFAKFPLVDAKTVVSASGVADAPPARKMAKKTPTEVVAATRARIQSTLGWHVIGFDAKGDELTAFLREAAATYNRKSLQDRMKKELRGDFAKLPGAKFGAFGGGGSALTVDVPLDSKRSWYSVSSPDGSFSEHPAGKPATGVAQITIAVVPDGARTWVLIGGDPATLRKRLAQVKAGKPDQTLATREGLDALKTAKASSASFATLEPAVRAVEREMGRSGKAEELKKVIDGLPNKGRTPLLAFGTSTGGAAPSMTLEMQMQKGTFDDLTALIVAAMAMKHHGHHGEAAGPVAVPVAPVAPPPPPRPPMKK
ncbi:MAG: hypothetical protein IT374_20745 [Polyangiaceae bacterium]|nr:hypothetical protein [Polyangiaceae bacterium]